MADAHRALDHEKSVNANGVSNEFADEHPKKRRKTAKPNSDKKFECNHEGCGKSYSRAEHLYRHQLNHTPKQIYRCDFPDCNRYFVRQDLCVRHRERHTTHGSQLQKRDSFTQSSSSAAGNNNGSTGVISNDKANNSLNRSKTSSKPQNSRDEGGALQADTHRPKLSAGRGTISGKDHDRDRGKYSPTSLNKPANEILHDGNFIGSPLSPQHSANTIWSSSVRRDSFNHSESHRPGLFGLSNNLTAGIPQSPVLTYSNGVQPRSSIQGFRSHAPGFPLPDDHTGYLMNTGLGVSSGLAHPLSTSEADPHTTADEFTTAVSQGLSMNRSENYTYPALNPSVSAIDTNITNGYPMFGGDEYNRSPLALGEDFTAWLFNEGSSAPASLSSNHGAPTYGDNPINYLQGPLFSQSPGSLLRQQSATSLANPMNLTNLMEMPAVGNYFLTDDKRQELLDMMQHQFVERAHDAMKERKELIFDDDIDAEGHILSLGMMQVYILSYWYHQHAQLPILHKPTFIADRTPSLLLLAVIAIGAATLDKRYGQALTDSAAQFANFVAWHIRWEIIRVAEFQPPAKLWVFQTLLLVEVYEKMYSTRVLHERAHIHHDSTLTLMRRGSSLMGRSASDTPSNGQEEVARSGNNTSSDHMNPVDENWTRWIAAEATRRVAFAAFVIDSIHCTMFGHSAKMVVNELRLHLPCDEALWSATSPAEVGRVNSLLATNGIKPIMFLESLKRTLSGYRVRTNTFGRTIIMAGLLSVSWHMDQRDLTMVSLGQKRTNSGQNREDFAVDKKWKGVLLRAYDNWKRDFDEALNESSPVPGSPHRLDPTTHNNTLVKSADDESIFESRTVLHHLAHIAAHVNIVDCQIYAGAARLLSRSVTPNDYTVIREKIGKWATKASARDSAFYALKFIQQVVLLPQDYSDADGNTVNAFGYGNMSPILPQAFERNRYIARDDYLLNRPWILYICALVVWCYGFALEGAIVPTPQDSDFLTYEQREADMKSFLGRVASVAVPDDLEHIKGKNRCLGLLLILKDSFSSTRWELTHEASRLLDLAARKLAGKERPDVTITGAML